MKQGATMRTFAVLLGVVGLMASGCGTALGERCAADGDCGEELVCSRPKVNGELAATGVCDYALRAENEPCTVAAECARELTCSNHFEPGSRYGSCVPQRADGEACFADRDCASGSCAGASGSALDGTCVAEEAG
jgi:hypothetical protein